MTVAVLPRTRMRLPVHRRLAVHLAVRRATRLAAKPPKEIRAELLRLRRGARPASCAETSRARDTVLSVSIRCCGPEACLIRSLATVLLCRARGCWPTWCAGVLPTPPFLAHAWLEADGEMVDEPVDKGHFRRLLCVPPEEELAGQESPAS